MNQEGMIPIKDKEGKLTAIVWFNMTTRSPEIYGVSKYGMDDVQELLEKIATQNEGKNN